MMAFNGGGSGESSSNAVQQSRSNNGAGNSQTKPGQIRRRRPAKGNTSGFGHGKNASDTAEVNGGDNGNGDNMSGSPGGQNTQPQHPSNEGSTQPPKPCHSARLALLCCQNAIRMGARTQLGLCPPGKIRRSLQSALRTKRKSHRRSSSGKGSDMGGYYGLEKLIGTQALQDLDHQEEDFLLNTNTFDVESDEEASSGDEDEVFDVDELLSDQPSPLLDDEKKYDGLREPLFTPVGTDPSVATSSGASTSGMGTATSGKLPFNQRKMRYFDSVTPPQRGSARKYLRAELDKCKRRERVLLSRHLRRMQRRERMKLKPGSGEPPEKDMSDDEKSTEDSQVAGVAQFHDALTTTMAAALLLESLLLGPVESLEGMSKCYDGIVSAGVALLEVDDGTASTIGTSDETKPRPSRSEILAALEPLLITSLEKPSGEVLLQLSKLRRMCATARYQRRFVQRIAPNLIRPPRGALWCLRHQNDMEPILAATELIFDSAHEIFRKGWYDRGQQLLADSVRTETLNSAAQQLRNLSSELEDGPSWALSTGGHGMRRAGKLLKGSVQIETGRAGGSEPLAEWEVIAVDRQIRISISSILSKDWGKVTVPAREPEIVNRSRRSGSASSIARGRPEPISSPRSPSRTKTISVVGTSPTKSVPEEGADHLLHTQSPTRPDSGFSTPRSMSPSLRDDGASTPKTPADTTLAASTPPRLGSPSPSTTPIPAAVTPRSDLRSPPHARPESPVPSSHGLDRERAPLSPSAPIVSEPAHMSARPMSSGASVSSIGSMSTVSQTPSHYRNLVSSAAERKRTVAACRALRSQIQRFEEAFIQLHGRPPKGAAERAPLATTYAQYREWKRAIRADAACRIQALIRGAITRWMLLRSHNPRLTRVVMTRAGRRSGGPRGLQEHVLKQLSIPNDIGDDRQRALAFSPTSSYTSRSNDALIERARGQQNTGGAVATSPHHWSNSSQLRRRSNPDRVESFSSSTSAGSFPSGSGASAQPSSELTHMSLGELQARKRELKQQLKQYDMNFARKHGRMPVKAEKEPIRHLYETYNALKSQITALEREGIQQQQSPVASVPVRPRRSPSPPALLGSGPDSSSDEGSPSMVRPKPRKAHIDAPSTPAGTSTSQATNTQDLAALKAEKGKLHQMLRSYEKDFFKEHRRQVSSFADIKPVASQYRRYKDIKKAIATLQQQGAGGEK